jgi:hypothetical protein
MADYLTHQDVENYGGELIDFTQRAAVQAVAPHLQYLEHQNAELQRRLSQEARHRLDAQLAQAVPNFREIDRDPNWHHYLLQYDPLSGQVRQQLLNDAVASGEIARVVAFFRGFQREHAAPAEHTGHAEHTGRRRPATHGKPVYSREQITRLYRAHQQGAYRGRESEWMRQEADIIAAGREGRILNPDIVTK